MSYKLAEKMLPYDHHGIFFVGYCDPRMPGHRVASAKKGQILQMTEEGPVDPRSLRHRPVSFFRHSNRQDLLALIKNSDPAHSCLYTAIGLRWNGWSRKSSPGTRRCESFSRNGEPRSSSLRPTEV